MSLHQTIKNHIKDALRAKDAIRLDTLRGLNALFLNEMLSAKSPSSNMSSADSNLVGEQFLADDKVLALIKRSVKQRKDSIEQFTAGHREDLVAKERAELKILESFLPAMMPYEEVKSFVRKKIEALKESGGFDPKSSGKLVGTIMKELAGKADGVDVKKAVESLIFLTNDLRGCII